jgi:LysM repeat protein
MNLNEIKKRASQTRQTVKTSVGKMSQAALAKLDDFRKSSVTQENSIVNKAITDYKQLTSLTLAGALVLTSGIFAYQKVDFSNPAAEMALNVPTVKEQHKTVESVIPTELFSNDKIEKKDVVTKPQTPKTIIADRSIVKGAQPFILKTALEQVDYYRELAFDGYALTVNGKEVAFFKNETDATNTIEAFKNQYLAGLKVEESYFKEPVETQAVRKEVAFFKGYGNKESVINLISKGTDVEKIHTVSDGESFWAISTQYGISVDNLIKANPKVVPERIKAGDKISLMVAKPLLTLCTVETVTYEEAIP